MNNNLQVLKERVGSYNNNSNVIILQMNVGNTNSTPVST